MRLRLAIAILAAAASLPATTLEHLTLDQMAQKSTTIVRGRVNGCAGELRQSLIYTRCEITVGETWKGNRVAWITVHVPGGRAGRFVQTVAGSPVLEPGQEYVFFLWAGRSGIHQVIGLHQGVFRLLPDGKGNLVAQRSATSERMLDSSGHEIADENLRFSASELKRRVMAILGGTQ
jgi:hypothetical protein